MPRPISQVFNYLNTRRKFKNFNIKRHRKYLKKQRKLRRRNVYFIEFERKNRLIKQLNDVLFAIGYHIELIKKVEEEQKRLAFKKWKNNLMKSLYIIDEIGYFIDEI